MIGSGDVGVLVVGFILAFFFAVGIGANDVANSFGTSVGARVLTLKQACILASLFETLGAALLGVKVSDTIRIGIIDVVPYENNTELLMAGNVAALGGSAWWMIAATFLRLPVSATHSIVGSTVGFAFVSHGLRGINWTKFSLIIGSWFISPILAGLVSTGIFFTINKFILTKDHPVERGLKFLPGFYAVTVVINLFAVFYDGSETLYFHRIPLWGTFVISLGCGAICALVVWLVVVPWTRRRILEKSRQLNETDSDLFSESIDSPESCNESVRQDAASTSEETSFSGGSSISSSRMILSQRESSSSDTDSVTNEGFLSIDMSEAEKPRQEPILRRSISRRTSHPNLSQDLSGSCTWTDDDDSSGQDVESDCSHHAKWHSGEKGRQNIRDKPEVAHLFSFLQVLTAVFGSFAHGGNDVSNVVGPLVSMWVIARQGEVLEKAATPFWILLFGGFGISLGLCVLGRKVIKTMGEDLTKITPSSGFGIEIGSAFTVLVASNIGIPISTTHCKVGSVVVVGCFRSRESVDWSIFRNIGLAWLVTLPVCGGISAAIMACLSQA